MVKNDGLAAGKGVVVTDDRAAAVAHAEACGQVVVEEYLDGPEVSLFVITDGMAAVPLPPAQDFKRVGDGDTGPNTGGMGAYAPLPWAPADLTDTVMSTVVYPTLAEMRRRGTPFAGLLYVGLALTRHGPMVVEFNARFGDPETQVVLPLLETPLAGLLYAAATGTLADQPPVALAHRVRPSVSWSPRPAIRRGRGPAVSSGAPRRVSSSTPARRFGHRTAHWSPPAAACSVVRVPGPTSPVRALRRTSWSRRSHWTALTSARTSPSPPSKAAFATVCGP